MDAPPPSLAQVIALLKTAQDSPPHWEQSYSSPWPVSAIYSCPSPLLPATQALSVPGLCSHSGPWHVWSLCPGCPSPNSAVQPQLQSPLGGHSLSPCSPPIPFSFPPTPVQVFTGICSLLPTQLMGSPVDRELLGARTGLQHLVLSTQQVLNKCSRNECVAPTCPPCAAGR